MRIGPCQTGICSYPAEFTQFASRIPRCHLKRLISRTLALHDHCPRGALNGRPIHFSPHPPLRPSARPECFMEFKRSVPCFGYEVCGYAPFGQQKCWMSLGRWAWERRFLREVWWHSVEQRELSTWQSRCEHWYGKTPLSFIYLKKRRETVADRHRGCGWRG